ncbi:hypothetical protein TruAng_006513 [Truncatella angustata]|nr:hypothetical protein TruAng_006513 [Truncatella angustata]
MLKAKFTCKRSSSLALKPIPKSDTVSVFVGPESREFTFSKETLSSTAPYFATRLDASGLTYLKPDAQLNTLWLEDLCPDMFELFAYWVDLHYSTRSHNSGDNISFKPFIDEACALDCREELHWDLVHVHLFAARIGLDTLQDAAMDGIQDLYLRCDWDITPGVVKEVYTECDAEDSYRLRKWIVAMTAWSQGSSLDGTMDPKMETLFGLVPDFWDDYVAHLDKSSISRTKLQFKNPQLRLPSNNLRNEERQFGYRQCSFHTHRASAGQGRCPHTLPSLVGMSFLHDAEDVESDDSGSEFLGGLVSKALVASPRTAIFELYLDIN